MAGNPPQKPQKPTSAASQRDKRRAEALRANLKRRKAAANPSGDKPSGKPDPATE
jgi:hypothetical protein